MYAGSMDRCFLFLSFFLGGGWAVGRLIEVESAFEDVGSFEGRLPYHTENAGEKSGP